MFQLFIFVKVQVYDSSLLIGNDSEISNIISMSFDNPEVFSNPQFDNDEPAPVALTISDDELHSILLYINYYRKIGMVHQAIFRNRVREFAENKIIIGVRNVHLPDNMRAFIAASAVQLTFGLEEWYLYHFHTIRVYPKEFYSRINEKMLKGGAGQNGLIWFSWKDYLAGYADQENGINLGLHEMGHALMINMQKGAQSPEFHGAFERLVEIEQELLPLVRNGSVGFLRKYAGANIHEFFAVSIEHFFEQPVEFKKMLPVLYSAISELLLQDPASNNLSADTISESGQPVPVQYEQEIPKKKKKNFRFANWHWSLTVMLIGIFIAPVPLMALSMITFVPAGILFLLYFAFAIAGGFYFHKKIVPTQALNQVQFILFLFFGIAPTGLTSVLLINRIPVIHETEKYIMTGKTFYMKGAIAVELAGHEYDDDPEVREIPLDKISAIRPGRTVAIHFSRGIFGMRYHEYTEILQ